MTTADKDPELHGVPLHEEKTTGPACERCGGRSERTDPLSKCVADALALYLEQMDGHTVTDLHRLVIEEVERPLFETVLRHTEGNLTLAARMLGLTRSTLRKRLAHYRIER